MREKERADHFLSQPLKILAVPGWLEAREKAWAWIIYHLRREMRRVPAYSEAISVQEGNLKRRTSGTQVTLLSLAAHEALADN
jgi:hypothetical protein